MNPQHRTRRRLGALALATLPGACCSPSWPPGGPGHQAVAIDNPDHANLTVRIDVDGDGTVDAEQALGSARTIERELPCGPWWIDAELDGQRWSLPLPLHRVAVRPPRLPVAVARPPAPLPLPGFVWIPAGPALVGDVLGVGQEDERPARIVDLPGFWLGVTEVSNADYARFLDDCGATVDPNWLDFTSHKCRLRRGPDGRWSTDAPTLPVVTVSHAGALAYCAQRTAATGRRHRLPTEREWEKAARGPHSWLYAYGNVYRQASANQESGSLHPVGGHPPAGFGLCDMTGNAFEWVADAYARDAWQRDHTPDAGEYRVLRGGSFVLDGIFLRNSLRMKLRPSVRADDVGFRVAVDHEGASR